MNIELPKCWPLNYDAICDKLSGDLSWVADFDCRSDIPLAVFHAANPDRNKGHQDYCCVYMKDGHVYVTGRSVQEVTAFSSRAALHCLDCDKVIYSTCRHNMRACGCPSDCFIDGGSSYNRYSLGNTGNATIGTLNLLTKVFKPNASALSDDK